MHYSFRNHWPHLCEWSVLPGDLQSVVNSHSKLSEVTSKISELFFDKLHVNRCNLGLIWFQSPELVLIPLSKGCYSGERNYAKLWHCHCHCHCHCNLWNFCTAFYGLQKWCRNLGQAVQMWPVNINILTFSLCYWILCGNIKGKWK